LEWNRFFTAIAAADKLAPAGAVCDEPGKTGIRGAYAAALRPHYWAARIFFCFFLLITVPFWRKLLYNAYLKKGIAY
jgi:hypothetical protein